MRRRLGAVALFAATLAACVDVLGIHDFPLSSDDGGREAGAIVESSVPEAARTADRTAEGSGDDSTTDAVETADVPIESAADVSIESAAEAAGGDGGAEAAVDAAADRSVSCSDGSPCPCTTSANCLVNEVCEPTSHVCTKSCTGTTSCTGGCCDMATGLCASGTANGSCGAGGAACVNCSGSSSGHLCLAHVCGCLGTGDCPAGLACQTAQYCGPGP